MGKFDLRRHPKSSNIDVEKVITGAMWVRILAMTWLNIFSEDSRL
jgi:hypothetical protein